MTEPTATATNPNLKELINFQTKIENTEVISNGKKINNILADMDRNALQIKNAEKELKRIQHRLDYPVGVSIASIKSMDANRGTVLALNPLDEMNSYQVNINGQCLTVYSNDRVMLKPCQNGANVSDSQRFLTSRIGTPLAAKTVMNTSYVNSSMVYPYNIFRSSITGKCMALNQDGDLIMQECSPNNLRHHWKISPNENICTE